MIRSKLFTLVSALAVGAMLLGACATPTPEVVVQTAAPIIQTQVVVATQLVPQVQTQVVVATAMPAAPAATAMAPGSVQINAGGATFPLPVYTAWTYAYQFVDPAVVINYQGIGSGGGKKSIIDRTFDFAGSDSVLAPADYTAGVDLQMYPMLAGAVVPVYNITGVTQTITLDRPTLVDIFLGNIKTWDDPAIAALNPGVKFPANSTITVAHRADGSGTTEIFTNALAAFAPDKWVTADGKPNAGQSIQWAVDKAGHGVGGKGNQGVAAVVLSTPNSIGYVELAYAISNNMSYPMLVNKAGKPVKANAASLASAINDFAGTFTPQLTNKIVDGGGDGTWPIAGYTYLILHTTSMPDCVKAQKILEYVNWTLTDPAAIKEANSLGYSTLPGDVLKSVQAKLAQVTCNGQPVMK